MNRPPACSPRGAPLWHPGLRRASGGPRGKCEKVAGRLGHRADPAGFEATDSADPQWASAADTEASSHRFPVRTIWNICSFHEYFCLGRGSTVQ